MNSVIQYLKQRKGLAIILALGYFVFILLMHAPMVKLSIFVMGQLTLFGYNKLVGGVCIIVFTGLFYSFFNSYSQNKSRITIPLLLFTIALLLLHTQVLFVMNIEIIHALQFAILAVLIFSIFGRFTEAIVFASLAGILDELYQYLILYPERGDYFDFNDVLMDQFGIVLAMLFLFNAGVRSREVMTLNKFLRSPALITLGILAILLGVLFSTGLFSVYQGSAGTHTIFVLNESMGPESFWRTPENSAIVYHVLNPLEGFLIILAMMAIYGSLDWIDRNRD